MYSNGISRRLIRYLFAESQGFLLRKRYAITNPSGFSSRLSSHEGPKACASGPSLRKDRDSCFASATRFLAPQALRDNEPFRVLIPPFFARRSESLRFRTFFAERQGNEPASYMFANQKIKLYYLSVSPKCHQSGLVCRRFKDG